MAISQHLLPQSSVIIFCIKVHRVVNHSEAVFLLEDLNYVFMFYGKLEKRETRIQIFS
jgi:hypothetical protein